MNQIKKTISFLFAFLIILILFPNQKTQAIETKTYKVGAFNNSPVIFKDTDGTIKGMYVDILTEIGQKENIKFEYIFGTWAEGLERIKTGEVDLLTSVGYTTERTTFMDFGKGPLLTVWGELYDLQSSQISGILDVSNKKIGFMKGDINFENFQELTSNFEINCQFIEFSSYDEVFQAVKDKKVDAGISGITFGASNQRKYGLKSTGVVFNPLNIYFTTSKGKNQALMITLDSYLEKWKGEENSFFDQAKQKWMYGLVGTVDVTPPWLINTAVVLGATLLIASIFVILLRAQVNRALRKISKQGEDLINSNELYNILNEQSPIAIELYSPEGILQSVNPACLKLFGITDIKEISKFSLFDDPNISVDNKNDLKLGKSLHYQSVFDFDKVRESNLYHTTRSGRIWLDITITSAKKSDKSQHGFILQIQDISEKKKNEELLNTDVSRINIALKSAGMGVWVFDIINGKREFDDHVCSLLGIDPSTFKGSSEEFFKVIHPDDVEKLKKALNDTINNGAEYRPEYRVIWLDKSIHHIAARGQLIKDTSNKPLAISGIIWDITQDKQDEEKLFQQNNLISTIAENTNEAVYAKEYSKEASGKYIFINDAGAKMLGHKAIEMIGHTDIELLSSEVANEFLKTDQSVISSGLTTEKEEAGIFDGQKRIFLSHKSPWKNNSGETIGVIGTSNDITERKNSEEISQNDSEKYRKLVELTATGFLILDNKGTVIEANAEYVRLSGHSTLAEIIGKSVSDWTAEYEKEKNIKAVEECLKIGHINNLEIDYSNKEGNITSVSINAFTEGSGDNLRIISLCRDITEKKNIEKTQQETKDRLLLATRAGGIGIWDYDIVNNKLVWDEQMYHLYGITEDKFKGAYESWQEGLHPDDKKRGDDEIQMALRGEKEFNSEFRVIWPDGTIRYIHGVANIQRDSSGKPLKMVGTNWDITDRNNSELQKAKFTEGLEKTNKYMVDRELKMIELKKENELLKDKIQILDSKATI